MTGAPFVRSAAGAYSGYVVLDEPLEQQANDRNRNKARGSARRDPVAGDGSATVRADHGLRRPMGIGPRIALDELLRVL
jgi:hypothetical protein